MKIKSIVLFLTCLLLLSSFTAPATACCEPPAPPCHHCEDTVWVYDCDEGQICCNGTCCDSSDCCSDEICCDPGDNCCTDSGAGDAYCCAGGKTCCDKACCDPSTEKCCDDIGGDNDGYCCNTGQECCDGTCCFSWEICCNGTCCDPDKCCNDEICCPAGQAKCCTDSGTYCCTNDYICCQGNCCDPATETCCNGTCCSKDNCCIDGECVSTCWTTDTISGSIDLCPDCEVIWQSANCGGTQREESDYDYCTYAGTGTAGYCECHEEEQVVGYYYGCKKNWDCWYIYECYKNITECILICGTIGCPVDVAACIGCILENSATCTDPCEFVEFCEKDEYNKTPIERDVFSGYGGASSCEG